MRADASGAKSRARLQGYDGYLHDVDIDTYTEDGPVGFISICIPTTLW
jgi:hypothetical protein